MSPQEIYHAVFKEYPDVLNVKQVSDLMGISTKTVYKLLNQKSIPCLKIGREFRIIKVNLMRYMKILDMEGSSCRQIAHESG